MQPGNNPNKAPQAGPQKPIMPPGGQSTGLKPHPYYQSTSQQPPSYATGRPGLPNNPSGAPGRPMMQHPPSTAAPQNPASTNPHQSIHSPKPNSNFAKPGLTSSLKNRQSPGLPHEYQSPHIQMSNQAGGPTMSGSSGNPPFNSASSRLPQALINQTPSSIQPHSMMPASASQQQNNYSGSVGGASGGKHQKSHSPGVTGGQAASGQTQELELHQPFNISSNNNNNAAKQANTTHGNNSNSTNHGPPTSQNHRDPPSGSVPFHQPSQGGASSSQAFYANQGSSYPTSGPIPGQPRYPGQATQPSSLPHQMGGHQGPSGYNAPPGYGTGSAMPPHMQQQQQPYGGPSQLPMHHHPMPSHGGGYPQHGGNHMPHQPHMIAVAPFIDEDQRQDFYKKQGLHEVPPFSTLNQDVIPRPDFLASLEKHMPKIETDLIRDMWKTIGLQTSDERVYKVASAMLETQVLKIVSEMRQISAQQQSQAAGSSKDITSRSSHISFDDLSKTMEEFDVLLRRPQFIEEKNISSGSQVGNQTSSGYSRPSQAYSTLHSEPSKRFHHDSGKPQGTLNQPLAANKTN